jgi:hypothetical protein
VSQRDIPEIARRFNAGEKFRIAKVPQGRLNEFHVLHRKGFLMLLKKHRIEYEEQYLWD